MVSSLPVQAGKLQIVSPLLQDLFICLATQSDFNGNFTISLKTGTALPSGRCYGAP